MAHRKKSRSDDNTYLTIGIIFLVASGIFFLANQNFAIAVPFFAVGVTFLSLAYDNKKKRDTASK